jgi:hypothetical protein
MGEIGKVSPLQLSDLSGRVCKFAEAKMAAN